MVIQLASSLQRPIQDSISVATAVILDIRCPSAPESYIRATTRPVVPDDLPSDVQTVLSQLFEETETAIRAGEFDTARRTVATATRVSRNKLPAGELRATLLHGCGEVTEALAPEDDVDSEVAAEYVRAMAQRLTASEQ